MTAAKTRHDDPWSAYKLRWNRRRLLWRCWRSRHALTVRRDNTPEISGGCILAFACVRNEASRLPYWLDHHRGLGVDHFLIVDNGSNDGTADLLAAAKDVSVWATDFSYRDARFGMDWLGLLLMRHGHGPWCLTLDADELLIYPHVDTRDLRALTTWLEGKGRVSFGAMMLDLFPKGPLGACATAPGSDPTLTLPYFDDSPYWVRRQSKLQNLWLQGGPRARHFFGDDPDRAPTLNKVPLVKWSRRFAYVSSTHQALPRALNHVYDTPSEVKATGVLLHTKFLDTIIEKSREELHRQQHFGHPAEFAKYHQALADGPELWTPQARRYAGWQQLCDLGLMESADWT